MVLISQLKLYVQQGLGFRVEGLGFRVQGSGFRVHGTWYLLTNDNCTYSCTYDHIRALRGRISGYTYSYNWMLSTMNLQVEGQPKP